MAVLETIAVGTASSILGMWIDRLGGWARNQRGLKREVKATLQAAVRAFMEAIPGVKAGPGTVALPGEAEALQDLLESPEVARLLEPLRDGYLAGVDKHAFVDLLLHSPDAPATVNRTTFEAAADAFWEGYRAGLADTKRLKEVAHQRTLEEVARLNARQALQVGVAGDRTDPIRTYLRKQLLDTQHLTIQGIASGAGEGRLAIYYPIEELYTPLRASGPACFERTLDGAPGHGRRTSRAALERCEADGLGHGAACLRALLQHQRHLLLLGAPGAGKTTFLRLIACVLAKDYLNHGARGFEPGRELHLGLSLDKPPPVPVFVRLAAQAGFLTTAERPGAGADILLAYLTHEHGPEPAAALARALDRGKALLLLDGLDEVVGRTGRERVLSLVADALQRWGKGRLVVSSRPFDYGGVAGLEAIETATVADFGPEQVTEFLRRWVKALYPDGQIPEDDPYLPTLQAALSETAHIRQMARNPVMLTCLCVVHWNERRLPEGKAALLQAVLRWLLNAKEERRRSKGWTNLFAEQCFKALALAMTTHPEGKLAVVDLDWATQQLAAPFAQLVRPGSRQHLHEEGRRFLEEEMLSSGIIERIGLGQLRFWHLTFQEHLAARALTELGDQEGLAGWWAQLAPHLGAPQWGEVVEHFAGCLLGTGLRRTNLLVERVLGLADADDLAATARAVGAAGRILRVLGAYDYVPPDPVRWEQVREQVMAIFEVDGAATVAATERVAAAEALGQAGDPRLRRPLLERMLPVPGREGLRLGRYPVTVEEFERFVADGGYGKRALWDEKGWELRQKKAWETPGVWEEQRETPNRPVIGVSWYEARAFCRWLVEVYDKPFRLPTEEEWQAVATHPGGDYPWGAAEPTTELANYDEGRIRHASAVGAYPAGAGRGGHLDLAGNVLEWCEDLVRVDSDGDEVRALRGGCWYGPARDLRSAGRYGGPAQSRYDDFGFRVCLPPRAR